MSHQMYNRANALSSFSGIKKPPTVVAGQGEIEVKGRPKASGSEEIVKVV